MHKFILLVVLLTSFFSLYHVIGVYGDNPHTRTIQYYMDANYSGVQNVIKIEPKICYKLGFFQRKISSINPGTNCIIVYSGRYCLGMSYKIQPGSSCNVDLTMCNMNDKISSLMMCEKE